MAQVHSYKVNYEIVKVGGGGAGLKYAYRKGVQQAYVAAASQAGVAAVLAGDVSLGSGESIEIIDIHEEASQSGLLT